MADQKTKPTGEKMKSEDAIPQADKQFHTEVAQHEGHEGEQAHVINQQETEKRKKGEA